MKKNFGLRPDGQMAYLYTIRGGGLEATISDFGGTLVSLLVPDKSGILADVVLGYEEAASYIACGAYLGATVGRNANRIGGAAFKLNGKTFTLKGGDVITTIGGVKGVVVDVKEDRFVLETGADRVRIEFAKFALSENHTGAERAAAESKKAKEQAAKDKAARNGK